MRFFATIVVILFAIIRPESKSFVTVRIPFDSTTVYDFSGATREGCDGLYNYFMPEAWRDGRITRLVADFVRDSLNNRGLKVFGNAQDEYILDSITYINNASSADTIDIFVFDKDNAPKDDTIDNTRSYTPSYHIVTANPGGGATVKITTTPGQKMQYFFTVIYRTSCGSSCTIWPAVKNISFWAHLSGQKDTTYNHYGGTIPWAPKDVGDLYGLNIANVVDDTTWFKNNFSIPYTAKGHSFAIRNFGYHNEVQRNSTASGQAYPNNVYDVNPYNNPFSLVNNLEFQKRQGHSVSSNRRGTFAFYKYQIQTAGYTGTLDDRWCLDSINQNMQKISSYYTLGNYMYCEAALGGTNASASRTNTRFIHGDSTFGKGYLKWVSIGNELEANFMGEQRRINPIEWAKMQIAAFDGDGGRMGAGIGAKNADPNITVLYQGVASWQIWSEIATVKRVQLHTRSRNYAGNGFEFHTTTSLKTDSFFRNMTSAEQLGNHGVYPEYWQNMRKINYWRKRLIEETGDINTKIVISEHAVNVNPYDPRYPVWDGTYNQPGYVSQLGTSIYRDSLGNPFTFFESAGIQVLTEFWEHTATAIDGSWGYQIFDDRGYKENVPVYGVWFNGIDASNGDGNLRDTVCLWPKHFMMAGSISRFGYYHCVDTLAYSSHGAVVFKYRSSANPDSAVFFVKKGDTSGTVTVVLPTGSATTCKRNSPNFYTYGMSVTDVAVNTTAHTATVTADVVPRWYVIYDPVGSPPPPAGGLRISINQTIKPNS